MIRIPAGDLNKMFIFTMILCLFTNKYASCRAQIAVVSIALMIMMMMLMTTWVVGDVGNVDMLLLMFMFSFVVLVRLVLVQTRGIDLFALL